MGEELSFYVERFRRAEDGTSHMVVLLLENLPALKLLAAWTMVPVSWRPASDAAPEDERELWNWLWRGVQIDWRALAECSGLDIVVVQREFESLRTSRLAYPDGTISGQAKAMLKAVILKAIKSVRPQQ